MPKLGAYDSRDPAVLEQHARWIAESGAGGINISWWGPGSFEDRAVHRIMDVMRDHDLRVTFHLEPYRTHRVASYVDDVLYLLREYGEKRRWDALLLLRGGDGRTGPVFKSFRTIVPAQVRDCHGRTHLVPDYVPDPTWRRQTDTVRATLRHAFDRVTLLADVSDVSRMQATGFDGMAIYDNFLRPRVWRSLAEANSARDLLFSFNVNPGFDTLPGRPSTDPDPCPAGPAGPAGKTPMEPPGTYDFFNEADWERLAERSRNRITETFRTTLALQTDAALANARRGFLLVYINSFNEWHEGHQFEPMKDAADLSDDERQYDYRNPRVGDYRLQYLEELMRPVLLDSSPYYSPALPLHSCRSRRPLRHRPCERYGRAPRAPAPCLGTSHDAYGMRAIGETIRVPQGIVVCVWRDVGIDFSRTLSIEKNVGQLHLSSSARQGS